MRLESIIRQLARSKYWQEIYNTSQKCYGIQLFQNTVNLSGLQVMFLYWLGVYSMLYNELYQLEWENLDIDVINDDDRCDAFLYWRKKYIEKQLRKRKREERKNQSKPNQLDFPIFSGVKNKEGDK